MKPTLFNLLMTFLLVIFFQSESTGQISKGDFILDFSGGAFNLYKGSDLVYANSQAIYLRLVTDKWMLGGSISYQYDRVIILNNGVRFSYPYHAFSISPSCRYYFSNGRFASFAALENRFFRLNHTTDSLGDNFNGYQAWAGVGFNYFLGKNVAAEASLTANLVNLGDYKGEKAGIFASAGLRLFFNSSIDSPVDSLPTKVLKKGVFTTSSVVGASHRFSEPSTGFFRVSPDLRYFITDRFNLFGSLGFIQYRFRTNNQQMANFGLGAEYYFKLDYKFYIKTSVKGNLSLDSEKLKYLFKTPYTRIDLPLSSDFNYFTKNKRLYTGFEYNYTAIFLRNRNLYDSKYKAIYAGMDYYLSQNIYVNGNINFHLFNGTNPFKHVTKSWAFRIGFLLGN